ncbi:MAG: putative nucleic acid-binding protein [Polaribacter sp.]|jgi:predicted nucleic acid-binding protein
MLIDTNILIYADRGNDNAKTLIISANAPSISVVTYMEYVPFCLNKIELNNFEKMLKKYRFKIIDINIEISMTAKRLVSQYALSHRVEMADALIAATALVNNQTVITGNGKHFKPIPGLKIKIFKP